MLFFFLIHKTPINDNENDLYTMEEELNYYLSSSNNNEWKLVFNWLACSEI